MTETTEKVVPKTTNLAPEEITNKDVTKAYLRWHFANEIPHSFERYLARRGHYWADGFHGTRAGQRRT